jgi:hypothetical protein
MVWVRYPWEWRGNDNGYPYAIQYTRHIVFFFRGSAAFCILPYGCGAAMHPWVTITFYDNNTLSKNSGVN